MLGALGVITPECQSSPVSPSHCTGNMEGQQTESLTQWGSQEDMDSAQQPYFYAPSAGGAGGGAQRQFYHSYIVTSLQAAGPQL